jgi:outer membrane biosynthesis protein TonB
MHVMVRRPLIATIVTTAAGCVFGALLGALVGRVIAFFGDETVQVSVPMTFCGTLGFFVGGASAAKGSLDRFGAKRSGLGAFVALVVLVVIVGGASVSHQAGAVIAAAGIVVAVLAGIAATLVAAPQDAPLTRGGVPRAVAPPKQAEAAPEEQVEAEFLADPAPTPSVALKARPAVRKVAVTPLEPEPEPEPVRDDEPVNWTLPESDAPAAAPKPRPKPTRAKAPAKAVAKKTEPPKITPPPAPRQRRDRPLRKGDS